MIGQLARELKLLLDEGQDVADVRAGLARWHRRGANPSALPSFVNEVANGMQPGRLSNGGRSHEHYRNVDDQDLYDVPLGAA